MIELKSVNVEFKKNSKESVHALNNVSLTVEKSDVFGIVGFSGAGKSTLVRTMNLLQIPTSGDVIFNGVNLTSLSQNKLRDARQKIGMIFQGFNLMPSRNVSENILLAMIYSKLNKAEKLKRVDELLELVELSDKKFAYPSELSGGQKQRVAIARALANDPDVLLCDEATSALDPQTTNSILKLLKSLNTTLGLTIVIITHEMQVVKKICNRVVVMENGRIIEEGDVERVFSNPTDPITRRFINASMYLDDLNCDI